MGAESCGAHAAPSPLRGRDRLLFACCALASGLFGGWLFSQPLDPNPTFESVTVSKQLVVAADENRDVGCRISADGTLTVSTGLLANQIRAQVIAAQSVLASTNPLSASFDQQQILAQMTADPRSGGKLIAFNREATLVPSRGAATQGNVTCIHFHPVNGRPEVFIHDLALGDSGKAYLVAYKQNTPTPTDRNAGAAGGGHGSAMHSQ